MLNQFMIDQNETLDDLLLYMPGVKPDYSQAEPAYTINGCLFCVVKDQGINIRLPEKRVRQLVTSGRPFTLARRSPDAQDDYEWLRIDRRATHDYGEIVGLLEEAIFHCMG